MRGAVSTEMPCKLLVAFLRSGPWGSGNRSGYKIIAELLSDERIDVNTKGGYYGTALQAASVGSTNKGTGLVEFLLENGADANIQGGYYGNALQALCHNGCPVDTLNNLLDNVADVNTPGGEYGNALQAAAARQRYPFRSDPTDLNNYMDIQLGLLSRGADVNQQGGRFGAALQAAVSPCNTYMTRPTASAVALLLSHGADVNIEGGEYGSALQAACASGDRQAALTLIDKGAAIHMQSGKFGSAWHAVSANLEAENDLLEVLLRHGVDVNDTGGRQHTTALQAALELEDREFKEQWTWNPDYFSKKAFIRRKARVRFLVARGANINLKAGKYGFPLQSACTTSHRNEVVRFLLKTYPEIDVNAQGGMFGTALQAAAHRCEPPAIRLLLKRGADVNIRGGKYGSALNAAVVNGLWDNVEVLLAAGATPDCRLIATPDEDWLRAVVETEEDGEGAVERYRVFWDVEKKAASGSA